MALGVGRVGALSNAKLNEVSHRKILLTQFFLCSLFGCIDRQSRVPAVPSLVESRRYRRRPQHCHCIHTQPISFAMSFFSFLSFHHRNTCSFRYSSIWFETEIYYFGFAFGFHFPFCSNVSNVDANLRFVLLFEGFSFGIKSNLNGAWSGEWSKE